MNIKKKISLFAIFSLTSELLFAIIETMRHGNQKIIAKALGISASYFSEIQSGKKCPSGVRGIIFFKIIPDIPLEIWFSKDPDKINAALEASNAVKEICNRAALETEPDTESENEMEAA